MQSAIQDKDQWSATADSYAKGRQRFSNAPVEMLFACMDAANPFVNAAAVLDVGSGPGVTITQLIETYGSQLPSGARLIASDFSTGMVAQIQKVQQQELDGNPIWSRVEAKVLDAQVLDGIEDASISHITGTMVYNLVSDGRQALQAAQRVLQPAGVIGMTLGAGAEWTDMLHLAAKKIRGERAPTHQFPKGYTTLDGIRGEFEAVGFSTEFAEITEFFLDVGDIKTFVDIFVRGKNPGVTFFVGDYSDVELDGFVDELARLIEEMHPETPRKLKGRLIVAVGKKLS